MGLGEQLPTPPVSGPCSLADGGAVPGEQWARAPQGLFLPLENSAG